VINDAGISPIPDRILSDDMREIRKTLETNFFGALAVVRAFAPVLGANGGGALLHVHSVLSWVVGDPDGQAGGHGAYSASKSAFWSSTNSLRLALAHQHTHVLGLHFRYTDTPMTVPIIDDKEDDGTSCEPRTPHCSPVNTKSAPTIAAETPNKNSPAHSKTSTRN
jgi:NAD(P)-dependent dehydrogenase (short-subunit alcohol dehydrogenase family)